jgi:hypothetical protein
MIIGNQIGAGGALGVASIIRYRYSIRNPRDAGTPIITLGLGVRCRPHGMAIVGTVIILIIASARAPAALPGRAPASSHETHFRIVTTDPTDARPPRRHLAPPACSTRSPRSSASCADRAAAASRGTVASTASRSLDLTAELVNEHVL